MHRAVRAYLKKMLSLADHNGLQSNALESKRFLVLNAILIKAEESVKFVCPHAALARLR
jgi:hypothetical protein